MHYLSDVLAGWLLGAAWLSVTAYAFRVWRREAGQPEPPIEEGLEPEAGREIRPAPDEQALLPHPWAKGAEILTGWVLTFGVLYVLGYALTKYTPGTWLGRWDDGVPRWLQTFRTPGLDDLSYAWSKAGDTHAITLVALVFCPLALALWRQWRPVLFVVLAIVGEVTLFLCAAAAVAAPAPAGRAAGRPDAHVVVPVRAHRRDHVPLGGHRARRHRPGAGLVALGLRGAGGDHAGRGGPVPDVPRHAPPHRRASAPRC